MLARDIMTHEVISIAPTASIRDADERIGDLGIVWSAHRCVGGVSATSCGGSRASPNGLPSESRQIAQRDPGWTTLPPSALTWARVASMLAMVK